jgi:hypothetical protein
VRVKVLSWSLRVWKVLNKQSRLHSDPKFHTLSICSKQYRYPEECWELLPANCVRYITETFIPYTVVHCRRIVCLSVRYCRDTPQNSKRWPSVFQPVGRKQSMSREDSLSGSRFYDDFKTHIFIFRSLSCYIATFVISIRVFISHLSLFATPGVANHGHSLA